jgi:hypothetical protein
MAGGAAVAVQKKIIRKFQDQCATDPRQAIPLESLGPRHWLIIQGLIRRKILVAADENRYYLDEDAAEKHFREVRRVAYLSLIVMLIGTLIAIFLKK